MSRVTGPLSLLAEVRDLLGRGLSVALHGPTGIGKSALLDTLEDGAATCEGGPTLVLRAAGTPTEHSLPFTALQDLLDQLGAGRVRPTQRLVAGAPADALRSELCAEFRSCWPSWRPSGRC